MSNDHFDAWAAYFGDLEKDQEKQKDAKDLKKAGTQDNQQPPLIFWVEQFSTGHMFPCLDPATGYTTWLYSNPEVREKMETWLAEDPKNYLPAADGCIYPKF